MAQVYERIYSRRLGNQITIVTDGNYYLLKVPFPAFGFLTKTLVQQASGVSVAFTAEVFNSNLGLTPGEITAAAFNAVLGWQQNRVVNPLAGTSGAQAQGFTPAGNPWRNMDGPDPVRSGVSQAALSQGQTAYANAQRSIYVLIKPAGGQGASSTWEVSINAFNEVGG